MLEVGFRARNGRSLLRQLRTNVAEIQGLTAADVDLDRDDDLETVVVWDHQGVVAGV